MKVDYIVNKICKRRVERTKAIRHMEKYLNASNLLKENGAKDHDFQKAFSSFYGVKRRNGAFKKEYFKIISKRKRNLLQILKTLYNVNRKVEFSFATKAIHAIDKTAPMWDRNVRNALGKNFEMECKIEHDAVIYEKLCELQKQLLKHRQVRKKIINMRDVLGLKRNSVSDEKILDFLLWNAGKHSS